MWVDTQHLRSLGLKHLALWIWQLLCPALDPYSCDKTPRPKQPWGGMSSFGLQLTSTTEGIQGWNSSQKPKQTVEKCCLLACFSQHVQPPFSYNQGPQFRGDTAHRGLGPHISRLAFRLVWWSYFLSQDSLFPDDSSYVKFTQTHTHTPLKTNQHK